jgi:hypothetical protein
MRQKSSSHDFCPARSASKFADVREKRLFSVQNSAFCMCFAYFRPASRLITVFRFFQRSPALVTACKLCCHAEIKKASTGVLAKHG